MFSKLRNALSGSPSSETTNRNFPPSGKSCLLPKFPYSRPHFLALSEDQVQASADHKTRPIITPNQGLSYFAGYAECINAGKSKWNEDQAVSHHGVLKSGNFVMPYNFYALFDGHAGVGASICAANQMHHVLHERLVDTQDEIWTSFRDSSNPQKQNFLIIGALEAAFKDMDDIIKEDRVTLHSSGGCTAIVAIFLLGHLFVANAGDSRAIVCKMFGFQVMSTDFTPETDRSRIRQLAQVKPELLGNYFTYLEYIRQPRLNDLGKTILYKDAFMIGWAHKTIAPEDLKIPIITGQGKRSRVMGTIGVTRGFGDHELVSVHQKVPIKPFLSCHPEVKVYSLANCSSSDVLIMGTDGLWDVVDGEMVSQIVNYATYNFARKDMCPTTAACLVGAARGSLNENCWMMKSGKLASVDDISVFVIPLGPCSQLTYTLRKQMQTEVGDGMLLEQFADKESPMSQDSESSDDYSDLLHFHIKTPKVKLPGVTLLESRKTKIVLQEENEYDEEIDIKDLEVDKNAAISKRSSYETVIEILDDEPIINSIDLCDDEKDLEVDKNAAISESSLHRTENNIVISDNTESIDESENNQQPCACKSKKDFISLMKEKQKQQRFYKIPFQGSVDTSNGRNSIRIADSAENNSVFAHEIVRDRSEIISVSKPHVKRHSDDQYHSDSDLCRTQNRNVRDTDKKEIVMGKYVPADKKIQNVTQQTTKTSDIYEESLVNKRICYNQTRPGVPQLYAISVMDQFNIAFPEYEQQCRAEYNKTFKLVNKTKRTEDMKLLEQGAAIALPSKPLRRTEHTQVSPEYEQRTGDTRESPEIGRRAEHTGVLYSLGFPPKQETLLKYTAPVTIERIKPLQMITDAFNRREYPCTSMPVRSVPPSPQVSARRQRTISYPSSDLVPPGPTRKELQQGARKKQYYSDTHLTSKQFVLDHHKFAKMQKFVRENKKSKPTPQAEKDSDSDESN